MESWAGPVANFDQLCTKLGVAADALSAWRKRHEVITLDDQGRGQVFPLDQFSEGQPIERIADLVRVAPSMSSAWLWLRQPHGAFDGDLPLDLLKAGAWQTVVRVAKRDFSRI